MISILLNLLRLMCGLSCKNVSFALERKLYSAIVWNVLQMSKSSVFFSPHFYCFSVSLLICQLFYLSLKVGYECFQLSLFNYVSLSHLRRALLGCILPSFSLLNFWMFCCFACIRASSLLFIAPYKDFHCFQQQPQLRSKGQSCRALSPTGCLFPRSRVSCWGQGSSFQEPTLSFEWAGRVGCQILVSTCPSQHGTSALVVRVVWTPILKGGFVPYLWGLGGSFCPWPPEEEPLQLGTRQGWRMRRRADRPSKDTTVGPDQQLGRGT